MNKNMLKLLKDNEYNKGKVINNLIKGKVLTTSYIINSAIESNTPHIIYYVAMYIKGLCNEDIDKLASAIIKTKNCRYVYSFAKNIKGSPVDKLADAIIEFGTTENVFEFARDVNDAPLKKLEEALIKSKNTEYIYKFIMQIEGASVDKLVESLISLKDDWYLCYLARDSKDNVLREKILNAIFCFNDAKAIYNYARIVTDAQVELLADNIIKIHNPEYIYKFACNINGAPIEKLANAIIDIGTAEYIYYFAKDVKNAPINKLAEAIIVTKEIVYIELFMHIVGAPIQRLNIMKNRIEIEKMTDEEKMEHLMFLAKGDEIDRIDCCADIYRLLFESESSLKQVEEKPKTKLLRLEVK